MPPLVFSVAQAPPNVCDTPACHALSQTLLANVNLNVDPCSDFFQFTCGNWLNTDPVKEKTDSFLLVDQTESTSLKSIVTFLNGDFEGLSKSIQETNPNYQSKPEDIAVDKSNFELAQKYYNLCLDMKTQTKLGYTPIFSYIAQIEKNLPYYDEKVDPEKLAITLAESTLLDVPSILAIQPIRSPNDIEYRIPLLDLSAVDDDKVDFGDIDSLSDYRDTLTSMLNTVLGGPSSENPDYEKLVIEEGKKNNFTPWSSSKIKIAVSRFIDFEILLTTLQIQAVPAAASDNGSDEDTTIKTTLADLKAISPTISWDTLFSTLVSTEYVSSNFLVAFDKAQIEQLDKILSETPVKTLQEYWIIKTVKSNYGKLQDSSPTGASLLSTNGFQKNFKAPSSREPVKDTPEEICGRETSLNFKNIVGRFFALISLGGSNEKQRVEELVDMLHTTWFQDLLPASPWIGPETKKAVIEKVKVIRKKVAYSTTSPDWSSSVALNKYYEDLTLRDTYFDSLYALNRWKNLKKWKSLPQKIDLNEWADDNYPEQFNAAYLTNYNSIEIPIGILQKPFYNSQYPQYINYGGVGAIIGHEFTHSLDNQGRLYDQNGKKANLFTKEDGETYDKKSECFVDQFNEFTVTGPGDEELHLNGTNVLAENIADSGGIHISYNAYLNWVKKRKSPEQTLPGFEKYTPEQLFFVSHAQFTCAVLAKNQAPVDIKTDVHASFYYRNIGAFQNSAEFAQAFNCKVDTPMNPKRSEDKMCSIW